MGSKLSAFLVGASLLIFAACSGATPTATPTAPAASAPAASATAPPAATTAPAATGTVSTAACQPVAGGTATVTIQGFAFDPAGLTVKAGTTVTWTNQDSTNHTATADDGSFNCGVISHGTSKSFTFTTAGTFAYHCAIHTYMKGTITVTS